MRGEPEFLVKPMRSVFCDHQLALHVVDLKSKAFVFGLRSSQKNVMSTGILVKFVLPSRWAVMLGGESKITAEHVESI